MPKRIRLIFPVPVTDDNARRLLHSQVPPELVRPGFEIEYTGSSRLMTLGDSYYDLSIMEMIVLEAGMRAEEEGCSAVCISTLSDSALYALRSRLNIPVVSPGQSVLHLASMLGHRFSIITMWEPWFPVYRKILREYGMEGRLASLRSIDTRPDLKELLTGKEDVIFDKLLHEATQAVEKDGADVIILGSTTMFQSHQYLASRLPVPVLNPGVIAYKLCEVLLELGLTHSKRAFPSPQRVQDDVLFRP
jgi:allantoin racemase